MSISPLAIKECYFSTEFLGVCGECVAVEHSNNFGMGARKEKVSAERAGKISERSFSPVILLQAAGHMSNKESKIEQQGRAKLFSDQSIYPY